MKTIRRKVITVRYFVIAGSAGMTGRHICRHKPPLQQGRISAGAIDEILKRVDKADTVLIGPGLGRCDDVSEVVESVLEYSKVPVIIDADGINAVAENMKALSSCTCPVIFTPHTVEMSRLTGLEREYIEDNRLVTAKEFAEENGVTLILKGHHTIVTGQDGEQYINITGNSGLATGGSGDDRIFRLH